MSSGTCLFRTDEGLCDRPKHHPGDHMAPAAPRRELCGAKQSKHSLDSCKSEKGHEGRHSDPAQGVSWPQEKAPEQPCSIRVGETNNDRCTRPSGHPGDHFGTVKGQREAVLEEVPEPLHSEPALLVPDSVRTRVRLHAAQTEYDLTVLRNRLECIPTVTQTSKELRRKREQLAAELEAWQYLSKITHTRMDR